MQLVWRVLKRIFSSVFLLIVAFVGAPVAGALTVFAGLIFLPLPATIPIPKPNPTVSPTIIYDRYGHPIATLAQNDRNIPVTENEIPPVLKEAVISDEDRGYYHQGGIDLRGTLRALYEDVRNRATVQGGSTITQQYVKLAYTNQKRTLVRKVREAILASQLAREASKDEILYRYLTLVYFGDGNYGIGAAAEDYFHVPVNRLDASQAAMLAGLIPAPSDRAPREHLGVAEEFRELVLGEMRKQGYLTQAQYVAAMREKLYLLSPGAKPPKYGTAVYAVQQTTTKYPEFVDYVVRWLEQHFSDSEIYGGGLRVQTTLEPAVQNAAYAAVRSSLTGTTDPLEMSLAAVEPQTGFVDAIVSGRHFGKGVYADDNFAIGACDPRPPKGTKVVVGATCWSGTTIEGNTGLDGRQPGSAWKPFVLATALEHGITPQTVFNAPGTYQIPGCTPTPTNSCVVHNDDPNQPLGNITLAEATWDSVNTVYAQLAPQVGCANVAQTAKKLGVTSAYWSQPPFSFCQTYALGEVDVAPLDMASAYGVFADNGRRAAPTPVLEVVNSQGKVLLNNISHLPATTQVMPANVAATVTNVLTGVIGQGTGTAAQLGRPAAGKTGTASNYTNAWFVGYTPTLSAAVWMGEANSQTATINDLNDPGPMYGGAVPAETWRAFMSAALTGVPPTPFSQPPPVVAPTEAAALRGPATTTTTTLPPVEPGAPASVQGTPTGGPYVNPPPTVVAPSPPTSTTTTSTTTSTTTLPASTTTTSTATVASTAPP